MPRQIKPLNLTYIHSSNTWNNDNSLVNDSTEILSDLFKIYVAA